MKGYLPIRTSTLKKDLQLGFDLYIKLPSKVLHYFRADDDIEQDRLDSLKSRKIRKLYINDEDEDKYQTFIDRCLEEMMGDESASIEEKSAVVVGASEATAERIMEDPHSKKTYDSAHRTANNLIKVLGNDEMLKGVFDYKGQEDDSLRYLMQKHAVNTCSLCISFAEDQSLPREEVEFLGVAALFHDIGFTQVNEEMQGTFFKPFDQLSAPELTAFKEHPKLGATILQDKEFANERVINLILTHEERIGGNGFPEKLAKLDMIQQIMGLCSFYDGQLTLLKKTRKEVFEDLAVGQLGNFDLELIKKFKAFIKKTGLQND
jgi:HD-GYP domain-containing protein (c-di-GMP phosphodiesterase class II)